MAAIAAAAVAAFAAVSGAVAAVSATVAAVGSVVSAWAISAGVAGAFSAAMTALKVLSVASSIYSLVRKPRSTAGTPSPVAFKADPNAPITFVGGEAAVGGNIVMGQTHAPKNRFLTYVTALSHGGPVHSVAPFTAADEVVTFNRDGGEGASGRYQDRMWQKIGLGAVGAAALMMTSMATKYTPAKAGPLTEWTANHKLSGIAHSMLSMWSDTERFPNGVPKPLWVVRGGPVYDPRKDSTYPGGVGPQRWNDRTTWSHEGNLNPHLNALSFLIGHTYNGVRFGGAGVPIGGIDVAAYVTGANVCDANGWKLSYPWSTAMRKWDVLATMLQAGGARPVARGAKISCVTQAPRVSIGEITEADLIGDFSVTGSQTRRDRINTVIPRVRMPSLKWTVQPYGRVTGATYVAEDNPNLSPADLAAGLGQRVREIEYEGVSGADGGVQARQLAGYDLTAFREGLVATLPVSVKFLRLRAGDCITVNAPETLLNGQKVVVIKREFDPTSLIVTLTVQSETDAKHAFALGQTDAPPPTPALTGVDPLVLEPPSPTAWEAEPGTRPGGGSAEYGGPAPVIRVTPGGGDYDGTDDEPSAREVLIRYRISGLNPGTGLPYQWAAPVVFKPSPDGYELTGLAPGTTYDLEIAYRARGVTSAWTAYASVTTGPLLATNTENVGDKTAAEVLADLASIPSLIDAAVAELDTALSGAIDALDDAVDALFGQVNDPGGVIARVGSLETATADLETGKADASRVSALEVTVNTPTTGLSARTATLETATADLALNKASSSRVSALEASVNTPSTGLLARTTSLETATADLATGKADASRVTAVEARVKLNAALSFPRDFQNRGVTWTQGYGGTIANRVPLADNGAWTFPVVEGEGYVAQAVKPPADSVMDVMTIGNVALVRGRRYKVTTRGRCITPTNGTQFAYALAIALNQAGGGLAGIEATNVPVTQNQWHVSSFEFLADNYTFADVIQYGIRFVGSGTFQASIVQIEDITADYALSARAATLETATADLALGKADASRVALVEAQVRVNQNRLKNPTGRRGLQNWNGIGGWSVYDDGYSIPYFYSNANTAHRYLNVTDADKIPVAANNTYSFQGERYCQNSFTGGTMLAEVDFYTAGGAFISTARVFMNGVDQDLPVSTFPKNTWVPFAGQCTSPAGAAYARPTCGVYASTNNGSYSEVGARRMKFEGGPVATFWTDDAESAVVNARVVTLETATADLAAGKADASRVTTLEARAGGSNLLSRTQFQAPGGAYGVPADYAPWSTATDIAMNAQGVYGYSNAWAPPGEFPLVTQTNGGGGSYQQWYSEDIAVEAGKRYGVSAYSGILNSSAPGWSDVYIGFYNAAGGIVSYSDAIYTGAPTARHNTSDGKQGGQALADYKRIWDFGIALPGVVKAKVFLRRQNYGGGSYQWWTRPMLSEVSATATVPAPWSAGAIEGRVTTQETVSADLYNRTRARWAIGTAVPGADAFISAVAELVPGSPPSSSVAIGARQVAIYNPAGGDWKKALEVSGGNVVLTGGLNVGAFIRLGTGQGWPVALKAVDFTAADGDVVSFGTDLGALPSLTYAMNDLAPLAAGETYDVRATGLTATGFTMRAKINVPGTPSTFDRTVSYTTSAFGSGGLRIDKTADANATDGNYRITGAGYNRHQFFGKPGGGAAEEDDYDYVSDVVEVWAKKAGTWVYVAPIYVSSSLDRRGFPTSFNNASASFSIDETVQLGDGVQEVGIRHGNPSSWAYVSAFTHLVWTAAGGASGVRSATPSGQKTRITVRPQ